MAVKKKSRRMSRDKIMRLIEAFDAEVNNGGFDQFFYNSLGNETTEIMQALEAIGASGVLKTLQRAASKFPDGLPPKDRAARQTLLHDISPNSSAFKDLDQEIYNSPENLAGLLEKFMGW